MGISISDWSPSGDVFGSMVERLRRTCWSWWTGVRPTSMPFAPNCRKTCRNTSTIILTSQDIPWSVATLNLFMVGETWWDWNYTPCHLLQVVKACNFWKFCGTLASYGRFLAWSLGSNLCLLPSRGYEVCFKAAPIKSVASAASKVNTEYHGDCRQLKDRALLWGREVLESMWTWHSSWNSRHTVSQNGRTISISSCWSYDVPLWPVLYQHGADEYVRNHKPNFFCCLLCSCLLHELDARLTGSIAKPGRGARHFGHQEQGDW